MNDLLRTKINELAKDILTVYEINTPIDDIESVVKKIGGRIGESNQLGFLTDGTIEKEAEEILLLRMS